MLLCPTYSERSKFPLFRLTPKNHAEKYKLGGQLFLFVDAGEEAHISHQKASIAVELTESLRQSPRLYQGDKEAEVENEKQGDEEENKGNTCPHMLQCPQAGKVVKLR